MAVQATVSIQISVSGLPGGESIDIDFSQELSPAIGNFDMVNLTTTITALSIPTGTRFVYIVPPTGNTNRIEVAGADVAGAELHPTYPNLFAVNDSSVLFLGCQTGTVTGVRVYYI